MDAKGSASSETPRPGGEAHERIRPLADSSYETAPSSRHAALDGRVRSINLPPGWPWSSTVRQRIGLVTLVVDDYDEAIAYFTQRLGFALVQDTPVDAGKRWVVVAPRGAGGSGLLLAKAADERQRQAVGAQAGGRVFLFLYTDDFERDHAAFEERGVVFVEAPRLEPYGTVAVFTDLYGNRRDLIEPAGSDGGGSF